tara:strand:- start:108 stop:248 length:141 start_codon:yes stop_codon:yes gene_type:complete
MRWPFVRLEGIDARGLFAPLRDVKRLKPAFYCIAVKERFNPYRSHN